MRLFLIRHAEQHHSARTIVAGKIGCTGLNDVGREQATRLADRFRHDSDLTDCAALLCSPVSRARQTADVLATVIGLGAPTIDCDLCEWHHGEADGMAMVDYERLHGAFNPAEVPTRPFAPGGESWNDVNARVLATLDRLALNYEGRTVAVVTHAGFIVIAAILLLNIGLAGRRGRLDPLHTSLTEWRVTGDTWQLARFNDTAHLKTLP